MGKSHFHPSFLPALPGCQVFPHNATDVADANMLPVPQLSDSGNTATLRLNIAPHLHSTGACFGRGSIMLNIKTQ